MQAFIGLATSSSLYVGLARPQAWDTFTNSDTVVPLPENTISFANQDSEDLLALKKLSAANLSAGVYKEPWTSNVKYDIYRHDWNGSIIASYNGATASVNSPTSLSDVKFVVVASNKNIYACIKQSKVAGVVQPSLHSPHTGVAIGLDTGILRTSDGYYWKYIASTSDADATKFASKFYHPILTVLSAPAVTDPYYVQWQNQGFSANFKGGIYTLNILTAGSGYNAGLSGTRVVTNAETDAEFKVIGDGIGLQYTVTYGSGGSIVDVEITNPGNGYTHATIVAATGAGATFDVIFTTRTGLGVDPARDVVARYLIIGVLIVGAEGGDFTTTNDFRKVLIVQNPLNFGTSTISASSTLSALLTINVGLGLGAAAYPLDAIVTGGASGAKARVVDFDTVTGNIRVVRTRAENVGSLGANNKFVLTEQVTSVPGTGVATVVSLGDPEVDAFSGQILYSEYRTPTLRNELQTEIVQLVLRF